MWTLHVIQATKANVAAICYRYLAESDFRYNRCGAVGADDVARATQILGCIAGKRLPYQTTSIRLEIL